jgi:signal transduction histidine kinase
MTESRPVELDTVVELLSGIDAEGSDPPREFYDRLCEAMCRLTTMERAGLLLYDDTRKLVLPVGSHGIEQGLLDDVYGTLDETPIAQRALAEDSVVAASEDLESQIPGRYASFAGLTTITCTPVSAGGRWLGVVFADRGGGRFELTAPERDKMWTLGKLAALAASARIATAEHARARQLGERIDLAREVHERVMQRLFGVSLVLGAERDLDAAERGRAADEIAAAVADLRSAMARPVDARTRSTGAGLREELERLTRHYEETPLNVDWSEGAEVPASLEPLAQSVLAEALRNAHKHATPTRVDVMVGRAEGTFTLEVRNDGASETVRGPGSGMGLRLAALDALQRGGVVEFGRVGDGEWRVRLVAPAGDG